MSRFVAPEAVAITVGVFHTCALLTGGDVECWGNNEYGQLGTGDTANRLTPTAVRGLGAGGQRRCGETTASSTVKEDHIKHFSLSRLAYRKESEVFKNMDFTP